MGRRHQTFTIAPHNRGEQPLHKVGDVIVVAYCGSTYLLLLPTLAASVAVAAGVANVVRHLLLLLLRSFSYC